MIASEAVKERIQIPLTAESLSAERIAYLEGLVRQARTAAAVFTQFTQEDVDRIVKAMVLTGLEQAQYLARIAVEETKLGVIEDKVIKNMVASEFVYNYVKDKRTVGVIREIPERNLVEMAEPIGVLFSLTPITNPTSTVLFKCIMVCTNVPGPQFPLYMLGHKMLQCYPYVPVGGEMAVNCAILSYNGTVFFGFSGDAHAAPDLKQMEKLLDASFTELRRAAGITTPQRKKVRRKTKAASTAAAPRITPAPAPVPAPVVVPVVVNFSPSESKRVPEAAPAKEQENAEAQLVVA